MASLHRQVVHVCSQLQSGPGATRLAAAGAAAGAAGAADGGGGGYVCPVQFSYRMAAQLVVSDAERQALLEASHVLRLR